MVHRTQALVTRVAMRLGALVIVVAVEDAEVIEFGEAPGSGGGR